MPAVGPQPKLAGLILAGSIDRHAAWTPGDGRAGNRGDAGDAAKCGTNSLEKCGHSRFT